MVFQHYSLYPWLRVVDNIRFCRQLSAHTQNRSSATWRPPPAAPMRCCG
jgi:NitT/TauT family transport system ATP-binding protein